MELYYIAITLMFVAGVGVGAFVERIRWNQLIEDGIIPKPRKG